MIRLTDAMNVLSTHTNESIRSAVVLEPLDEADRKAARQQHLYIAPLKVQELFTILTATKEG
ncbi:hypothetical protein ACFPFV_06035 [Salinicoccus siamensis]|uniref:hypothetical protein n=1 Tax=Salinicoccus siamensis TaxID=381830 RepID=UPI003614F887